MDIPSVPTAIDILYRDDSIVAINKPGGLLVHRSPVDRHETRFALQLLRDQLGRRVYPVHRLDKPTSGLLLFALDPTTAQILAAQFADRSVEKAYLAIVRGWCPEQGRIDHPLREQPDAADTAAHRGAPKVQAAVTDYQRLACVELDVAVDRYPRTRYSLVLLRPLTGRRHQLRRHMKHISHPIIGDANHGKGVHNRFFQQALGCDRLLLASVAARFTHPHTGQRLHLRAPPGAEFDSLAARFGWTAELEPFSARTPD
ncbi:MAG: pseudouridine synthase [Haliea sp.]|uniref:pseudouridine synthase n=1 Tax=Haliea sp. TaxID=1932666 RepID=UPI0032EEA78C